MRKFLLIIFLIMSNIHADDAWSVFNHFKKEAKIVANFSITNYDDKNEPYDKQVGTYYYHPQYGSKWNATDPYQQITWVNKTGVVIFDIPLNQVTEKSLPILISTLQQKFFHVILTSSSKIIMPLFLKTGH